jgi:hypothetical protein
MPSANKHSKFQVFFIEIEKEPDSFPRHLSVATYACTGAASHPAQRIATASEHHWTLPD